MLIFSFPVFVVATVALIFFTSNRYGWVSRIFPYPVFMSDGEGLRYIYVRFFSVLVLPMLLFMLRPMILFFRVFREKIDEVIAVTPVSEFLFYIGMAPLIYRVLYLESFLLVIMCD